MWSAFLDCTRCPAEVAAALAGVDPQRVVAAAPHEAVRALGASLAADPGGVVDDLRLERYQAAAAGGRTTAPGSASPLRRAYYLLRPALPVAVRKHLQRIALRDWQRVPFPAWPVDTSVEDLFAATWSELLLVTGRERLPFIWYWPDGHDFAAMLTHDVETAAGRDFCGELMAMEAAFGLVSAFEIVPEERYEVPDDYLATIRDGGCEVCLHGLNHDGHLFDSEEEFVRRAASVNRYLRDWGARGFRSPVMYRRQEWFHHLAAAFDMSVPNTARLDPQRGGCCTVLPYFVGDVLELPQTTIQDYSLLAVLDDASPRIWWEQLGIIADRGGLASFIVHPDYLVETRAQDLYRTLLVRLAALREEGRAWLALPGEINDWWRCRRELRLVETGAGWTVTGDGAERARVAWAVRENDELRFEVET